MSKSSLTRRVVSAFLFFILASGFAANVAAQIPAARQCFDFTGSGRTSFATTMRDTNNIIWRISDNPTGSQQTIYFDLSEEDSITPGYYDTDNRADLGIYRPFDRQYFVQPSTGVASQQRTNFGAGNDVAGREADYDGDGRDDLTVIRDGGANLTWFYLRSNGNTLTAVNFGLPGFTSTTGDGGDLPIAGADYTGDGRAELTVIRRGANGAATYFVGDSQSGAIVNVFQWGNVDTDLFVVGDYVGDRRADFAAFRTLQAGVNGTWYIRENGSASNNTIVRDFGFNSLSGPSDRPICGDYNGDGKQDIAIYRSSDSTFFWLNSPGFNTFSGLQFGRPGDSAVAGLRAF